MDFIYFELVFCFHPLYHDQNFGSLLFPLRKDKLVGLVFIIIIFDLIRKFFEDLDNQITSLDSY